MKEFDLFGEEIISKKGINLREKYIEPPFSTLNARGGEWQDRKRKWKALGIKSELGRETNLFNTGSMDTNDGVSDQNTSIFDSVLCEIIYEWFCSKQGKILDPFAGGSVRGIVANYLGYNYTGIDIREEQIQSNLEQCKKIIPNHIPEYIVGDSNNVLDGLNEEFDFVFSCPPYVNLEVYSQLEGDISNIKNYADFMKVYEEIIKKSCDKLKKDCFACFVVSEVRDKNGNFYGFVPDTINAFRKCGLNYYNEIIYLQQVGSASIRANNQMKASKKVARVHQNVLIFKK